MVIFGEDADEASSLAQLYFGFGPGATERKGNAVMAWTDSQGMPKRTPLRIV